MALFKFYNDGYIENYIFPKKNNTTPVRFKDAIIGGSGQQLFYEIKKFRILKMPIVSNW